MPRKRSVPSASLSTPTCSFSMTSAPGFRPHSQPLGSYSLINTRLMTRRPMIINTNLQPNEFEKRYSAAIASRLLGDFTQLRFFGDDIRLQKEA